MYTQGEKQTKNEVNICVYCTLENVYIKYYNIYGGEEMGLQFKIDILDALKEKGYTTYKLRKEKLLSESTIQLLRNNKPVSWEVLETLCKLLMCKPEDILMYEE